MDIKKDYEVLTIVRNKKGRSTLAFPNDYIVLDIETTGLSPKNDSIIEIAALRIRNNKIIDEFNSLINPNFKISKYITDLTGITNNMLKTAPTIKEVLSLFLDFVGSSHIIGHNVNFDINFIYDRSVKILNKPFSNNFSDTMQLSRIILKDLPNHKLSDIASYYKISYDGAHRALVDCKITQKCFENLKETALENKTIAKFEKAVDKTTFPNFNNTCKSEEKLSSFRCNSNLMHTKDKSKKNILQGFVDLIKEHPKEVKTSLMSIAAFIRQQGKKKASRTSLLSDNSDATKERRSYPDKCESPEKHIVSAYTRKNGTQVKGYLRGGKNNDKK